MLVQPVFLAPSPHRHVLCRGQSCTGHMSVKTAGESEEQNLSLTSPGGYTACPGPHRGVIGKERERACIDLGLCLFRV